uniref:Uncharacterized protein n=1 Tax=Strongyloides papillosus TaxID=174720 RepID=A0A0N5CIE1_STREA
MIFSNHIKQFIFFISLIELVKSAGLREKFYGYRSRGTYTVKEFNRSPSRSSSLDQAKPKSKKRHPLYQKFFQWKMNQRDAKIRKKQYKNSYGSRGQSSLNNSHRGSHTLDKQPNRGSMRNRISRFGRGRFF